VYRRRVPAYSDLEVAQKFGSIYDQYVVSGVDVISNRRL